MRYALFHRIRQTAVWLLVAGCIVTCGLVYYRIVTLVAPGESAPETIGTVSSLLSTLMQVEVSVVSVTIPLLFIIAQFTNRPRHSRLVVEFYSGFPQLLVLSVFLAALVLGGLSLANVANIVRQDRLWIVDANLVFAGAALGSLIPLVMFQIESLNPYQLGVGIVRRITPRRISDYSLVRTTTGTPNRVNYELVPWNRDHSISDPLGSFHELLMGAVEARDRILMELLTRLLFERIARWCGALYPTVSRKHTSKWRKLARYGWVLTHGPANDIDRVTTALHLLHYLIRRAARLKEEWGPLDPVRRHFAASLADLIECLAVWRGNAQVIDLSLLAAMHIGMAYADVGREGKDEPWVRYFGVAQALETAKLHDQAHLCLDVLAVVTSRTRQILDTEFVDGEALLSTELRAYLAEATAKAGGDQAWWPAPLEGDPWTMEVPSYKNW